MSDEDTQPPDEYVKPPESDHTFDVVATAQIIDQPIDGDRIVRKVVVYKYMFEDSELTTAFYRSSGTSFKTGCFMANTFVPFYGETDDGKLIKAQRANTLSKQNVKLWKLLLDKTSIHLRVNVLNYFDNFTELQISAYLGGGFWECEMNQDLQKNVLSYAWDGEKYSQIETIIAINKGDIGGLSEDRLFEDRLFEDQLTFKTKPDDVSNINVFLAQHGALGRDNRDHKKGGKRSRKKTKKRKTKKRKTKKRKTKKRRNR